MPPWLIGCSSLPPMMLNGTRKTALTHLAMMFPPHFTPRGRIESR
jgi:hypothetical protein